MYSQTRIAQKDPNPNFFFHSLFDSSLDHARILRKCAVNVVLQHPGLSDPETNKSVGNGAETGTLIGKLEQHFYYKGHYIKKINMNDLTDS